MNVGEVFVRMALDNKDYRSGLDREEAFTRQRAMTLGNIFSKGFSVALGIGLVHGFKTVGGMLTDLITTAAKTETLDVAMQAVARSSGYPIPVLQQQRKEVMALGIAEQEATQMMTRFMQAQLDTADAARIARIAQDAGTLAAMNSSDATTQITEAIAKLRPELLTAFGFTRNLNDIYGDYARTTGKAANQLSEVEKKQAMLNYIFKEGEKIAGAYESAMGTVGKQMGSLEKLELSKKLMQELKTAFARPVLLPAFGVWVEAMHKSLGNLQNWMEANQATLQRWGQTAKNVVAGIVRGVQRVTNAFIKNWATIKFAGTAFLSYLVLSRAIIVAKTAVAILRGEIILLEGGMMLLNGRLMKQIPLLVSLSAMLGTYRLQVALAPVATNFFAAALYRLQAALYAVHTALGPVGWIILALSGLVAGGMALWNKYASSVRAANDAAREAKLKELADKQNAAAKAAMDAIKGENKLADAIGKAGKAANNNLQAFDEVHILQEDMAGLGDLTIDTPEVGDLDSSWLSAFDDFDFSDMFGDIDEVKTSLRGFWDWLKSEAGKLWDEWSNWVISWGDPLIDAVANWWNKLMVKLGFGPQSDASGLTGGGFSVGGGEGGGGGGGGARGDDSAGGGGGGARGDEGRGGILGYWDGIVEGIKKRWENLKTEAPIAWENIKENISNKIQETRKNASTAWENIKTTISTKWNNLKTSAGTTWDNIKENISTRWENLKTSAGTTWENIKTNISTRWDNLKKNAPTTWENIKSNISTRWNALKTDAPLTWESIKTNISNRWDTLKRNAPTIWENIKTSITTRWNNLKTSAPATWENIKNTIQSRWNELKSSAPVAWENIRSTIQTKWNDLKNSVGPSWNSIKTAISNKWSEIKTDAFNWGRNIIQAFTDGLRDKVNSLKNGLINIGKTILDFLGFKSPTKKGPGRYADQWAPNFIEMFAKGLASGIPEIERAAGLMTDKLSSTMSITPSIAFEDINDRQETDSLANSLYQAVSDAMAMSRISNDGDSKPEISMQIDGITFARIMVPYMIREFQRTGVNLVGV